MASVARKFINSIHHISDKQAVAKNEYFKNTHDTSNTMNCSQPTPYTSWISSINMAPLVTPCHYWSTLTNHHSSYHINRCTYNYSIITTKLSCNNIQMNKILYSNYFTTDIIHHSPHDISINTSARTGPNQFHATPHSIQSSTQVRHRYINYTLTAFSVALLIVDLTQPYNFNDIIF